ncbi:MAG: hypothetical protein LBF24_03845 [Puniceicoccales bacterium]|jgi:hypothetical protein|nr:hypothetical protein [Puniceicoccales bacterium]
MAAKTFVEDLPFQCALFEKFAEKCSDDLPVLLGLSEFYLAAGRVGDGLRTAVRATVLAPENPNLHYVLACAFALSRQSQFALDHLKLAVQLGYDDLRRLERDQRLQSLQESTAYRAIVRLLRQKEK